MKIAFINNMNNYFFAFTRYLRDAGVDAHVFVLKKTEDHFKPEADTFSDVSTLDYVHEMPYTVNYLFKLNPMVPSIKSYFSGFDIILACGPLIAFLAQEGIRVDVAIPYGSDFYSLPFEQFSIKKPISSLVKSFIAKKQREGLRMSRVIIIDETCDLYRLALKEIGVKAYNVGIPMLYSREFDEIEDASPQWSFLNSNDFVLFNHTRQWWKTKVDNELEDFDIYGGAKRNDKLIRAFATFVKCTKFQSPILVLFEYGADVLASKELITELKIDAFVKWMPVMHRKNILLGLKKATFASNAFRENEEGIGGVCYEALSVGTCLLNNISTIKEDKGHFFQDSPMIHVLSEEDILNVFIDYENDTLKYKKISKKSKSWYDKKVGVQLINQYIRLFTALNHNKKLTHLDSEIRDILIA
ncbi:MAG: hypothetical protein COB02_14575 [Candidatus Cloacimonadota bacterium]|nr:MAG: hypothetical protein COB02_14575 [Candidatus Cloacimonadota bacterium]